MSYCRFLRKVARVGLGSLLFCLLLFSCQPDPSEIANEAGLFARDTSGGLYEKEPIRGTRGPLMLHMEGDAISCSTCHVDGFTGEADPEAIKLAHEPIHFDHGSNRLCLNCHNKNNADEYIGYGDVEIPGDTPTDLCRKCHGPHYREWIIGVHGRSNGSWMLDGEHERKKLDCIQCHDPHHPKFPKMVPKRTPVHTRFELDRAVASHADEQSSGGSENDG